MNKKLFCPYWNFLKVVEEEAEGNVTLRNILIQ